LIQIISVLRRSPLILILYIILSISLFSNTDIIYNVKTYAHLFTPDETANFVGIIDQIQAELELVSANLADSNVSFTQNHANKAASLLTPKILAEIAEDNPRLTDDLRNAMNQMQNISSSSESQVESVSHLVSDLNERLGEDAMVRMAQVQPSSSNFLEEVTKFLGNIFGGGSGDTEGKDQNTKLEALALANVIDGVLINYGNAYRVGFDMTNMSNMVMIGNSSSDMNMQSMNTLLSNTMMQHGGEMNMGYSLANMSDYQSAQALAAKASEIFNTKIKNTTMDNNKNVTAFITNLENGLTQLNNSFKKSFAPRCNDDSSHTNSSEPIASLQLAVAKIIN
jgi:DNA-directed RNA polymerase subunit F